LSLTGFPPLELPWFHLVFLSSFFYINPLK
jgi:hypothetical protein